MCCCSTIVGTPVVCNGRPGNQKQPCRATVCVALKIQTAHGFEKDLRRQVLSHFPVPHMTIHEAIDAVFILLIKELKLLYLCSHCHSHCVLPHIIPPRVIVSLYTSSEELRDRYYLELRPPALARGRNSWIDQCLRSPLPSKDGP